MQAQTLCDVVDDQFLTKYRALLDAEDEAFDELEHAYEDGDRAHFDTDLDAWRAAGRAKAVVPAPAGAGEPPRPNALRWRPRPSRRAVSPAGGPQGRSPR